MTSAFCGQQTHMWLTDTHAGKALTHIRKKKDDEEGYGPGMTYVFFFLSWLCCFGGALKQMTIIKDPNFLLY